MAIMTKADLKKELKGLGVEIIKDNFIRKEDISVIANAADGIGDHIGKFWVVTTPSKISELNDILFLANVAGMMVQAKGGLKEEDVVGLYPQKDEAKAKEHANFLLKKVKEMHTAAAETEKPKYVGKQNNAYVYTIGDQHIEINQMAEKGLGWMAYHRESKQDIGQGSTKEGALSDAVNTLRMHEVIADSEGGEDEPCEDDAFLWSSGELGSKTSLSIENKPMGQFDTDEAAEAALVAWINKNKVRPCIWFVDDHGGINPYELSKSSQKKITWSSLRKAITAGKWTPDAEDLYDYANNVEHLYNELQKVAKFGERYAKQTAEDIIEEYNEVTKAFPERKYVGTVDELAKEIVKWEVNDGKEEE